MPHPKNDTNHKKEDLKYSHDNVHERDESKICIKRANIFNLVQQETLFK